MKIRFPFRCKKNAEDSTLLSLSAEHTDSGADNSAEAELPLSHDESSDQQTEDTPEQQSAAQGEDRVVSDPADATPAEKPSSRKKPLYRRLLKWLLLTPVSPLLLVWFTLRLLWRLWCGFIHLLGFKRIDSYILKKFLNTYFFLVIAIITIFIIFDFNEKIDKLTGSGATPLEIALDYYGNYIPYFANLCSPLFIFIAVIFITTNLASHSEIIAMKSTGMSFRRLLVPYLIGATLIGSLTFCLGGWVIPRGNVHKNAFENKYVKKRQMVDFAENVQLQVDTGVIAYIATFDNRTKTGSGLLLSSYQDKQIISHLEAETIQYDTLASHKHSWTIRNYKIRTLKGTREHIVQGEKLDTTIMMEPKDFFFAYGQQETMTIPELHTFISSQRLRGSAGTAQFEVEYQRRFADPFSAFILTLIGVALSCEKRKGGMGTSIGIGLALTFTYILFQKLSSSMAINGGMSIPLSVWTPNILYAFIALWYYIRTPK